MFGLKPLIEADFIRQANGLTSEKLENLASTALSGMDFRWDEGTRTLHYRGDEALGCIIMLAVKVRLLEQEKERLRWELSMKPTITYPTNL